MRLCWRLWRAWRRGRSMPTSEAALSNRGSRGQGGASRESTGRLFCFGKATAQLPELDQTSREELCGR